MSNSYRYFQPEYLSERENYKLLIGSIIPRPIALVTTLEETAQIVNIAPFSYFNAVTADPPLLSVSVQRAEGEMKDTARNLLHSKEAVVHVVDEDMVLDANETAVPFGAQETELSRTRFQLLPSQRLTVPSIKEAKVAFETRLYQHLPIESEGMITADLFLLEVVLFKISEAVYLDEYKIDPDQHRAIGRLAGNAYSKIGEIFSLERPTE